MPVPGPAPRTGLAGPAGRRGGPDADGARRTARPPAGPPPRAGRGRGPCAGCPPPSRTGAGHGGPAADARHSAGPPGGPVVPPGSARRGPPRAGRAGRASGDRSGELDGPEGLVGHTACGRAPPPGAFRSLAWAPASPRPGPRRPGAVPSAAERVPVRGRGRLPARGTRGAIGRGEGWPAALGRPSPPVARADDGTSEAPPGRPGGEEPSRGRRAGPPLPRRTGVRHRRGPLPHPSGIDRAHRSPIVVETIWKRVRKLLYREHVRRVPSSRDRREPRPTA